VSNGITHERAFELLPWLVNGSLQATERELVEEHVSTCLSCHREIKEQQRLRVALRAQPAVHISAQSGYEKLTRELGDTPPLRARRRGPLDTVARFAVVGVAGVALLGTLLWLVPRPGSDRNAPVFETLATEPASTAPTIDLIFVQSITAVEMQQLLVEINGSIASGPSDLGRYTVRLDNGGAAGTELDALLARLQKDPRVRFAGHSLAAGRGP
jgi:hypothetical protein